MPIRVIKNTDAKSKVSDAIDYIDRQSDPSSEVLNFYKDLYSRPEVRERILKFLPEYEYDFMKPVVGTANSLLSLLPEGSHAANTRLGYLSPAGESSLIMENPELNYTDLQDREILADLLINRYLSPTAIMRQGPLGSGDDPNSAGYVITQPSKSLGTKSQPFMMGMQRQQQKQTQKFQVDSPIGQLVRSAADNPDKGIRVIKKGADGMPIRDSRGGVVYYPLSTEEGLSEYATDKAGNAAEMASAFKKRIPTAVHEASHAFDRGDALSPEAQLNYIMSLANPDINRVSEGSMLRRPLIETLGPRYASKYSTWDGYLGNPTEVKARLNEIRYKANAQGVDPTSIPREFIEKENMKRNKAVEDLIYMYGTDNVTKLLNEVY